MAAIQKWLQRVRRRGAPCIELLVLQPTPFCNIDCDYCYLPNRDARHRMSEATLRRVFERVFASPYVGDRLSVVWHAGEPLVLPPAYYERAFEIIEETNADRVPIVHSIQTNGLLIDADWVRVFKAHDIQVGLSLDGPRALHDAHRKTRAGKGTFERALAAVHLLNREQVPFHVITVVTRATLDAADELYAFYRDNGIRHAGFNIDEIEGANTASSLAGPEALSAYGHFLRRFLELTKQSPGTVTLREFSGALHRILDRRVSRPRNPQVAPMAILSIDAQGNMSTFSPELLGASHERFPSFAFGNVHDNALPEIFESETYRRIAAEVARGVEACKRECQYFNVCGGGAPANKLFEHGRFDTTETLYCRATTQAVMDVVLEDLEADLTA